MPTVHTCPTVVAHGARSKMRGGSVLGSSVPSLAAQYQGRNHDNVRERPHGNHKPRLPKVDARKVREAAEAALSAKIAAVRDMKARGVSGARIATSPLHDPEVARYGFSRAVLPAKPAPSRAVGVTKGGNVTLAECLADKGKRLARWTGR